MTYFNYIDPNPVPDNEYEGPSHMMITFSVSEALEEVLTIVDDIKCLGTRIPSVDYLRPRKMNEIRFEGFTSSTKKYLRRGYKKGWWPNPTTEMETTTLFIERVQLCGEDNSHYAERTLRCDL